MYDKINIINMKLDNIKFADGRKLCKVSGCGDYVTDVTGEDTNYCNNHGKCLYCYEDANRPDSFICSTHRYY